MPASTAPVHLRLLGVAACVHGSGETLLEPKDALLLAHLAIVGATPRKALAALLWPDAPDERALANLRQRLLRLRKSLGVNVLQGTAVLGLRDEVQVDVADPAAGSGELLTGVTEAEAGALAAWLASTREQQRAARIGALAGVAAAQEVAGQLAQALATAQQLLALEPTSERAHRRVMRLHYLRGDVSAALLAFDRCEQVLKDEVGARPSAETLALLHTIEQAQAPAWVSGQPLPAAVLRPPRLVGREVEMAAARRAWLAGEAFVLTGDAGVGKSRLLGELFDTRADVLVLRARPGDEAVPLATLLRLVLSLAERWPATLAHAAHAQLLKLASGSGLDPNGAIRSAVPLTADLLRTAQAQGLTGLVLDDLQFADDASLDTWCECLAASARPALARLHGGFASRVAGVVAQERIERLRQVAGTAVIAVPPLAVAQTQSLLASLALPGTDVVAVAAALDRRIGGNPLHLLETIRSALEQHGQLRADRLDTPGQVLDLLEQRLAALNPDGLLLVRIAAVAGSDFGAELAQAVSRRDVLELADAWTALERQGILDERGFAHDLMMEATLRLLPRPIQRVIHARVAEFIAARGAPPARLAHHWLHADEPLAALPALIAAARLAWRAGRGRETRDAFFRAADIEVGRGQPDAAFALLFECAEAMARLCPVAAFDEVVARLRPLEQTPSHRARIVLLQAGSRYLHGDHAGSDRGMAEAQLLAIACGDQLVEAECLYDKAWHSSVDGRLRDAVEQLSACANLQRALGLERLALITDASKLGVLRKLGHARPVLAEQQRTLAWLIDNGAPVDVATSRIDQVLNQLDLGDVVAADAAAAAAWQAVRDTDMRGEELCLNARTMLRIHRLRGRWDEALGVSAEVAQRLRAHGEDASALASERAELYLDLGRPELAWPYIEIAGAEAGHLEHTRWHAAALGWRHQSATGAAIEATDVLDAVLQSERFPLACEIVLGAGRVGAAQLSAAALTPLIAGCEAHALQIHLLPLRALQAWLLLREGAVEAAAASAARAQAAFADVEPGAALPACALWLAKALHGVGRLQDAAAVVRHATVWVAQREQVSVPAEFRASFRQRNPVHRELLALAPQLRAR